ncbi:MAG: CDP-alcohol phosphatidyltransferase family protein [Spirochaetes bacterium]|nr:CDP-alcohol phosphatidyltransferase family protein [Spirochaetota bacterium]
MERKTVVIDFSLLTPIFTKFVAEPLFKFVPWWLPANIITIISNLCIVLAMVIAILVKTGVFKFWQIVPLLIIFYLTGDIFDGKQARRTKTCSKLGEFLDHFFDIFVVGFLVSIIFIIYEIIDPLSIAIFLSISFLPFFGFYYEQYKRRTLFFEKLGAFEGVSTFILFIVLGFIEPTRLFLTNTTIFNFPLVFILFVLLCLAAVYSTKRNLDRIGTKGNRGFLVYLFLNAITVFFASHLLPSAAIMFVIAAYCGGFIGRLHIAYLLEHKEPIPDFIFPLFLAVAFFVKMPEPAILTISIVYQVVNVLLSFLSGFIPLRKHWVWINPEESEYLDVYTV